jgi:uncharacterized protein (TIGR03067 family)
MRLSFFSVLAVGFLLAAIAAIASVDVSQDEAVKKDRKQIEGTWRIMALEVDGTKLADADANRFTVVNGFDGTWSLYSDDKEISKGTSTFDSSKQPKAVDITPTVGEGKRDQFLGIYEIGENTRKLCFAPPGIDRPTEFASTPASQCILVTFEREKAQ